MAMSEHEKQRIMRDLLRGEEEAAKAAEFERAARERAAAMKRES